MTAFSISAWIHPLDVSAWIHALGKPAWIEALATVAAVVAAVFAGFYAKKAFDKEVERDKERDGERRRAQADRVAAWCDKYDFTEPPKQVVFATATGSFTGPGKHDPWFYYLRNASDVPVYDVLLLFTLGEQSLGTEVHDVLPPGEQPLRFRLSDRIQKEALAAADEHGTVMRLWVAFRDAAGNEWRRDNEGRLLPANTFRVTAADDGSLRAHVWWPRRGRRPRRVPAPTTDLPRGSTSS